MAILWRFYGDRSQPSRHHFEHARNLVQKRAIWGCDKFAIEIAAAQVARQNC